MSLMCTVDIMRLGPSITGVPNTLQHWMPRCSSVHALAVTLLVARRKVFWDS